MVEVTSNARLLPVKADRDKGVMESRSPKRDTVPYTEAIHPMLSPLTPAKPLISQSHVVRGTGIVFHHSVPLHGQLVWGHVWVRENDEENHHTEERDEK